MKHRYPGIHSFTADEQDLFFGRDREKKELYRLISLNEAVVLFGKSGTGKTSLLQAGVGPMLAERRLQPVKLRLNNTHQPVSRQVFEQLNDGDYLPLRTPDTLSLWEYCKLFEYYPGGERFAPVLLLDQFEELFTLYHDKPEAQHDFIGQLAEVLNHKTPAHVLEAAKAVADETERARLLAPPQVNIVISIRSDFLYLLDRLSARIPSILRCRYELQALDEANTRRAITLPPALPGAFASLPFSYSEAALQEMLDSLVTGEDGEASAAAKEVEPFQAQMLCRYIEQKIIDEQGPQGFVVTPGFYGGSAGIADIRKQYYNGVIAKFDANTRPRVERLLGEFLLSNDRRIIQEHDYLLEKCALTDADLALLCTERLLKEEPRGGSFYYEISHDKLVPPIVEAREARLQAEEALRLEQERTEAEVRAQEAEARAAEEKERAEEARRLQAKAEEQEKNAQAARRRATWFAWGAVLLALVAAAFGFYAVRQSNIARDEKDKAEQAKLNAERQEVRADSLRVVAVGEKERADLNAAEALREKNRAEKNYQDAQTNLKKAQIEEARTKAALEQVKKEQAATEEQRRIAEENYRIAQVKTREVETALEQVKKEQAATEEQRRIAEENYRIAQDKTREAETEAERARQALEAQKKALADIVRLNLADADRLIVDTDYETAHDKVRAVQSLGVSEKEVSDALMEFAFWYAETGDTLLAWGVLDTAYRLVGRSLPQVQMPTRAATRQALRALNPAHDSFLQARYFPVMLDIPGGTFGMGSETGRDDEKPVRKVTITAFRMAQTETTWWQYLLFCKATKREEPETPSWGRQGDNPVVNVSWYDAVEYANWLSERKGLPKAITGGESKPYIIDLKAGYRLPTEAEWEYAARAGKNTLYAGGDDIDEVAWDLIINSGGRSWPVRGKAPNAWGLYDMSGNVWEWCWDWYGGYPPEAQTNPVELGEGSDRVLRGGSWGVSAERCRVSRRGSSDPGLRIDDCGFRVVLFP
jgi:sulfatase modifying factor 1